MIVRGKQSQNDKEIKRALDELRGNTGAETATDRPLTDLEKLSFLAAAVKEAPLPEEEPKAGFMWKRYYDASGVIMWELAPDPSYVDPDGSYTNPIVYAAGMTVTAGLYYTDGADVWECIKDGIPESFGDTDYFNIIT